MVSVDDLEPTRNGFNFDGKLMSFDAPMEFYATRLEELLEV